MKISIRAINNCQHFDHVGITCGRAPVEFNLLTSTEEQRDYLARHHGINLGMSADDRAKLDAFNSSDLDDDFTPAAPAVEDAAVLVVAPSKAGKKSKSKADPEVEPAAPVIDPFADVNPVSEQG